MTIVLLVKKRRKKMKILSMIRVTLRSFLSEILYIGTWKFHTVVYVIYFFQIDALSYIFLFGFLIYPIEQYYILNRTRKTTVYLIGCLNLNGNFVRHPDCPRSGLRTIKDEPTIYGSISETVRLV